MSAQQQVFDSPELVEIILLFLPMRDLLLAQRTCRYFQDIIQSSPVIQEALYFKPQSRFLRQPNLYLEPPAESLPNALLANRFPCFLPSKGGCGRRQSAENIKQCFWTDTDNRISAITRRGASWRRMIPLYPAIKAIHVVVEVDGSEDGGDPSINFAWLHGDGEGGFVTMGQIYDTCAWPVFSDDSFDKFSILWPRLPEPDALGSDPMFAEEPGWRVGNREFHWFEVVSIRLWLYWQCVVHDHVDEAASDFLCEETSLPNVLPEVGKAVINNGQYIVTLGDSMPITARSWS